LFSRKERRDGERSFSRPQSRSTGTADLSDVKKSAVAIPYAKLVKEELVADEKVRFPPPPPPGADNDLVIALSLRGRRVW